MKEIRKLLNNNMKTIHELINLVEAGQVGNYFDHSRQNSIITVIINSELFL